MNPHPDAYRFTFDCQVGDGPLSLNRCPDRIARLVKCGRQRVAGGGEDMALVRGDRRTQKLVVFCQGHPHAIRVGFPQTARSLDVRKEKGHHSGRR